MMSDLFFSQSRGTCLDCHDLAKMIDWPCKAPFLYLCIPSGPMDFCMFKWAKWSLTLFFLYRGYCSLPQTLISRPDWSNCKPCQGELKQKKTLITSAMFLVAIPRLVKHWVHTVLNLPFAANVAINKLAINKCHCGMIHISNEKLSIRAWKSRGRIIYILREGVENTSIWPETRCTGISVGKESLA